MTEYSSAHPQLSGSPGFNRRQVETHDGAYARSNPFTGACKAVRTSIEQFEAGLDTDHEVSMQLVSFGAMLSLRPERVGFSTANLITFHGFTDDGEQVHLVQHVSQVNMMLRAARKQDAKPNRVIFQYGGA
ncbi:MAG: DUF6173 family protein [Geobacteraceae bacterium]|nr:DUF6173 family protein [Geobacteraceae bacterium]